MRFEPEGDLGFQLDRILNEGLEFNDNFRGGMIETDLVVGENTIQHGLGFVPIGYLTIYPGTVETPVMIDDLGGVFSGTFVGVRISEWTTEILFLNASVASQGVRLFVL